jgi:hypothetical protein
VKTLSLHIYFGNIKIKPIYHHLIFKAFGAISTAWNSVRKTSVGIPSRSDEAESALGLDGISFLYRCSKVARSSFECDAWSGLHWAPPLRQPVVNNQLI